MITPDAHFTALHPENAGLALPHFIPPLSKTSLGCLDFIDYASISGFF